MKKVVKFKFEDKEGFLSVIDNEETSYTLVQKDTPKVESIIKTGKLLISSELKNPVYQEIETSVSYDQTRIKWVYEALERENNLYFKQLDETLCVLIMKLK